MADVTDCNLIGMTYLPLLERHGLSLLSHMLFSAGDLVFVEDPTYFLAKKIFDDAGMKIIGCKFTT